MKLFALVLIFMTTQAYAEYRVFTLHIVNKTKQTTKQIHSTLDPEQYVGIYPLAQGEEISYVDTWRCPGRTDFFRAHCDNPRLLKPLDPNPEVLK